MISRIWLSLSTNLYLKKKIPEILQNNLVEIIPNLSQKIIGPHVVRFLPKNRIQEFYWTTRDPHCFASLLINNIKINIIDMERHVLIFWKIFMLVAREMKWNSSLGKEGGSSVFIWSFTFQLTEILNGWLGIQTIMQNPLYTSSKKTYH